MTTAQEAITIDELVGDDIPSPFKQKTIQNAVKRGVGRPPVFTDPQELKRKIDEYFELRGPRQAINPATGKPMWQWVNVVDEITGEPCMTSSVDADGKEIMIPLREKVPVMTPARPPTVAGLSLHLGFTDYRSIYQNHYRDNPEFYSHIKGALDRMADFAQEELYRGNSQGARFWLKNHGWADKVETELYGRDGGAIKTEDVSKKDRGILEHFFKNHKDRIT